MRRMRIIARSTVNHFMVVHPETKSSLQHWFSLTKAAQWKSTGDVMKAFPKAVVLNAERVRFEIAGGNYRLIAAFDFARQLAFVKFLGTHSEYDRVDVLTISQF
jgi:mRNA interferase HigB